LATTAECAPSYYNLMSGTFQKYGTNCHTACNAMQWINVNQTKRHAHYFSSYWLPLLRHLSKWETSASKLLAGICIKFTEAADYTHTRWVHERPQNLSLRVPAPDSMVNAASLFSHTAHTTGHLECVGCTTVMEDDAFKMELSPLLSLNSSS
jgi:hypothetical protein